MKKKSVSQPNWRPDFRDPELLPDIKVIRTDFIVNFIAVTAMLLLAFFIGQREYRSFALGKSIAKLEAQIEEATAKNQSHLRLNKRFRESANRLVELEQFYTAPIVAYDYLVELGTLRPDDLAFESLAYRETAGSAKGKTPPSYTFQIKGKVRSLTVLDAFKDSLAESSFAITGYEKEIDENTRAPDEKTGIFPYSVDMRLSPPAKKKSKAKDA